jgi:hypothetical protein
VEAPKGLYVAQASDSSLQDFGTLRKHALVVGINEYENHPQGISNLRFAVRDARAIYDALVDPQRGGFRREDAEILCDDCEEKPTSTAIGKAISKLVARAEEGDLVVIFFSGHGLEEGGRAYLLPRNADLDALDYTALERDTFIRQVDRMRAKKIVVVLDACHSGGVTRGGKSAGKDAALTGQYYEQFAKAQGRAFIASCSGGELSWEDENAQQGVFTGALVRGLSGRADKGPEDGLVSLIELQRYVESEVTDWARRLGKSQRPQATLESSFGDIPLAFNQAYLMDLSERREARAREARDLRAQIVQTKGLTAKEIAQAVALTDRYGQGDSLTSREEQDLDFVRKFAAGAIDLRMYRAGMSPPDQTLGTAPAAPKRRGRWSLWAAAAVATVTGESIGGNVEFAPLVGTSVALSDRVRMWVDYQHVPFKIERQSPSSPTGQATQDRAADFMTLGPSVDLKRNDGFRVAIAAGLGAAFGEWIRNDRANAAGTIQLRFHIRFSGHTDVVVPAGIRFGSAETTDPESFRIEGASFLGVGVGLSN